MGPESEIRTVKNWLIWLWISPLFTLPSLIQLYIYLEHFFNPRSELTLSILAVLGSGCWHLILLIPSITGKSEFIRWHGRQALLITVGRSAIALFIAFAAVESMEYLTPSILLLVAYWLFFNILAREQANRGDCALMRWMGHGASLPLPVKPKKPAGARTGSPPGEAKSHVEDLIKIIRFGDDPKSKQAALAELEQRGMIEPL